MPVQN